MTAKDMTLWQVIDYLGSHMPLRLEKIEQLFELTLSKLDSSNPSVTFWEGRDGFLQNNVRVSRLVLGVRNNDEQDPGMLTLNVTDKCLKLDDIKNKYGELAMAGAPQGRSEDEETTFEAKKSRGVGWSLGFAVRNPDCLSGVGIGPKK